jgi:hypothetical protein
MISYLATLYIIIQIIVSYKNEQVKKCLTKAGQALEMKIYTTAKALLDKDGVPFYDDTLNGVVIDWDGEFHDESVEDIYDTENEIDVMLMHDVVPVFISCKNGTVTSDELYKLNTVADHYGFTFNHHRAFDDACVTAKVFIELIKARGKLD